MIRSHGSVFCVTHPTHPGRTSRRWNNIIFPLTFCYLLRPTRSRRGSLGGTSVQERGHGREERRIFAVL